MMSSGAGILKVSRGLNAISREEVSMATLEVEPPQEQPLTGTVTLNKFRQGGRRGSKNPQ